MYLFTYLLVPALIQEILNLAELTEQIDALRDNMTYIQDNVSECQTAIVHMEEFRVCTVA